MKLKIKETALSSFRQYKNPQQNISEEELAASISLNKNKHIVIQKFDKGNSVVIVKCNSVVIVDKDTHIKRMESFLSDQRKFEKNTLKHDAFKLCSKSRKA